MVSHAVVLAGGLGTRIRSVLGDTPKALAEISGVPFIDWKMDELRRNGVTHVTLLLGRGSAAIASHLAAIESGFDIHFIEDGPVLLGTGGAILNALPLLPEEFYVTYGDCLLDLNYRRLDLAREEKRVDSALAVTAAIGQGDSRNSRVSEGFVVAHDKEHSEVMDSTDYGVMLLTKTAILNVGVYLSAPTDLSLILGQLARAKQLAAVSTNEKYWEIGTPETLDLTRNRFGVQRPSR